MQEKPGKHCCNPAIAEIRVPLRQHGGRDASLKRIRAYPGAEHLPAVRPAIYHTLSARAFELAHARLRHLRFVVGQVSAVGETIAKLQLAYGVGKR